MSAVLLAGLLLAAFPEDERPRHPLAPSIPLLSKEEVKRVEAIIDRLISYDVGKLKGEAAKKAVEDFNRLGPESIFQLIDGFNRTVILESSCPCVLIARKIALILNSSEDVALLTFARENLGAGPAAKRHVPVVADLKFAAQLRRSAVERSLAARPLGKRSVVELSDLALKGSGAQASAAIEELARRPEASVAESLARAASSAAPERVQLARTALDGWVARQPLKQVQSLLQHAQADVRASAARAAAKHGLALAPELIELLADNDAAVAQAARQALVQAAGVDFGPSPGADADARAAAISRWRAWWKGRK